MDDDEIIEIMRSLPEESLANLIADSILNFESFYFTEMINIRNGRINVLVSPSKKDKVLLLNAISILLSMKTNNTNFIDKTLELISEEFNKSNIKYIKDDDINFYNVFATHGASLGLEKLSFTITRRTLDCIRSKKPLKLEDSINLRIQLFVYASVWFDMDRYLKYLYYLYR